MSTLIKGDLLVVWTRFLLILWLTPFSIDWSRLPDLPLPRGGYYAAWHRDGLLIAGGTYWHEGRKIWTDRAHILDPRSGRWFDGTPLPRPLGYGAMVVAREDLYMLGGCDEGTVYRDVYRMSGKRWVRVATMPEALVYFAATAVGDKIYLFGGTRSLTDLSQGIRRAWSYELRTGAWREIQPIPGPPRLTHAAAVLESQVYLFGGATQPAGGKLRDLADTLRLDTASGTWKELSPMPRPTRAGWALPVGGVIYFLGGAGDKIVDDVLRYDPVLDRYSAAGKLPIALADIKFFLYEGAIYGAGGEDRPRSRFAGTLVGRFIENPVRPR